MGGGDEYGQRWSYRVFSEMNTEPDTAVTGRRYLTVHHVDWRYRPVEWPLEEDVIYVEACPASPSGVGQEVALLDAERILQAFDHPTLIKAEWRKFFNHSEEQHRLNREAGFLPE